MLLISMKSCNKKDRPKCATESKLRNPVPEVTKARHPSIGFIKSPSSGESK